MWCKDFRYCLECIIEQLESHRSYLVEEYIGVQNGIKILKDFIASPVKLGE